ncbi:fumarylacetoacetate hydrolase family protein [Novosphingobium sp. Rr 2-17]|uniref:fumarylacetoacetate hydrolase family protein n=1 Tax=Novosphingobium sp. Rr 2-17 TaxID=555793 RepID=UPI0012F67317
MSTASEAITKSTPRRCAITPAADAGDIDHATIVLEVNRAVRKTNGTDKLIWSIAKTIAYLSQAWPIKRGDLIYTDTSDGVSAVPAGMSCRQRSPDRRHWKSPSAEQKVGRERAVARPRRLIRTCGIRRRVRA